MIDDLPEGKILDLVIEPDPYLHQVSEKVAAIDQDIQKLVSDMLATMYDSQGIGLAAVQVGVLKKVIVIDIDHYIDKKEENEEEKKFMHGNKPLILINAEITEYSEEKSTMNEGCLSFPEIYTPIERPSKIKVKYLNLEGKHSEMEVSDNLLTVCIQHEVDHTEGKVFLDYVSKMKKELFLKKLEKKSRKLHKTNSDEL